MKEYKNSEELELANLLRESHYLFTKNKYSIYQITNKINGMIYVKREYYKYKKQNKI